MRFADRVRKAMIPHLSNTSRIVIDGDRYYLKEGDRALAIKRADRVLQRFGRTGVAQALTDFNDLVITQVDIGRR